MIYKIEFLSLITFLNLVQFAFLWPSGAPEKVCDTLTPKHGNNQPKGADLSPFVITQSHSTYQPGDRVRVVVQAPDGYSFRGLIVQAYDPGNSQPIGSFSSGRGLKTIDACSAVTHTDRRGKRSATLIWDSPEGVQQGGQVAFRATIVQRFSDFFAGLEAIPDSKA